VAGVLYFCGLGHSWPGCATSDNFIDLETLTFEPIFLDYMQHVFKPVGVMLRVPDSAPAGEEVEATVIVFSDLDRPWQGEVTVRMLGKAASPPASKPARVEPYGKAQLTFPVAIPEQLGKYEWEATIPGVDGQPVRSRRVVSLSHPTGAKPANGETD
jgi:uncharacterized protein YfaS (alpha-2-macroglobulin family)